MDAPQEHTGFHEGSNDSWDYDTLQSAYPDSSMGELMNTSVRTYKLVLTSYDSLRKYPKD